MPNQFRLKGNFPTAEIPDPVLTIEGGQDFLEAQKTFKFLEEPALTIQPYEPSAWDAMGRAVGLGLGQSKGLAYDIGQGVGIKLLRSLGGDDLADEWLWNQKQRGLSESVKHSVEEDIISLSLPTRVDQINSVGGAFQYGFYQLAKEMPTMATQFALSLGASVVTGNPFAAPATFAATSYILGAGEVYASSLAETGDAHLGTALAAGIPIAFMDTLPVSKILSRMGRGSDWGNWVGRNIQGKWKRRAVGAMETSIAEGTTEAFQSVIEQMAVDYTAQRGISWDNFDKALRTEEFKESFFAGGAIGLALGPFGAGRSRRRIDTGADTVIPPAVDVADETTLEAEAALGGTLPEGPLVGARTEVTYDDDSVVVGGEIIDETREDGTVVSTIETDDGPVVIKEDGALVEGATRIETFPAPSMSPRVEEFLKRLAQYTADDNDINTQASRVLAGRTGATGAAGRRRQYIPEDEESAPITREDIPEGRRVDEDTTNKDLAFWKAYEKIRTLEDRLWGSAERKKREGEKRPQERTVDEDADLADLERQLDLAEVDLAIQGAKAARANEAAGGPAVAPDGRSLEELESFLSNLPDYMTSREAKRISDRDARFGPTRPGVRLRKILSAGRGRIGEAAAERIIAAEGGMDEVKTEEGWVSYPRKGVGAGVAETEQRIEDEKQRLKSEKRREAKKAKKEAEEAEAIDKDVATFKDRVAEIIAPSFIGRLKPKSGEKKSAKAKLMDMLKEIGISQEQFKQLVTITETRKGKKVTRPVSVTKDSFEKIVKAIESYVGEERLSAAEQRVAQEQAVEAREAEAEAVKEDVSRLEAEAIEEDTDRAQDEALDIEEAAAQEAAVLEKEESHAVLVRDSMEKEDGVWKSIEKGEITEAEVRDLAAGVDVESGKDVPIKEVIDNLRAVDKKHEITEKEIESALDRGIPQKRRDQLKRRVDSIKGKTFLEQRKVDDVVEDREVSGREAVEAVYPKLKWMLSRIFRSRKGDAKPLMEGDFIFPEWLIDPIENVMEATIGDGSIFYDPTFQEGAKEEGRAAIVGRIIAGENAKIRERNKAVQASNAKKIEKDDKTPLKSGKPRELEELEPLIDKKSDKVLPWADGQTSKQVVAAIEKHVDAIFSEPEVITKQKDKIQERLAKKKGVIKKNRSAWNKLRPKFVSPTGLYVMRETSFKVGDRTVKEIHVAYNQADEVIAVQDFDNIKYDRVKDDLNDLRSEYGIGKGGATWADVPAEKIVRIFQANRIPLKAYGILFREGHTQDDTVNFSDSDRFGRHENFIQEGDQLLDVVYLRLVDDDRKTSGPLSEPPEMNKVWVGSESDIPSVLKPFMQKKDDIFVRKGNEDAFILAFSELSKSEQNKFTKQWKSQSKEITISTTRLNKNGVKERVRLTGRITNFRPSVLSTNLKNVSEKVLANLRRVQSSLRRPDDVPHATEEVSDSLQKRINLEEAVEVAKSQLDEAKANLKSLRESKLVAAEEETFPISARRKNLINEAVSEVKYAETRVYKAEEALTTGAPTTAQQVRVDNFIVTTEGIYKVLSEDFVEFTPVREEVLDSGPLPPRPLQGARSQWGSMQVGGWEDRDVSEEVYKIPLSQISFDRKGASVIIPESERVTIENKTLVDMLNSNVTRDREDVSSFLSRASETPDQLVLSEGAKVQIAEEQVVKGIEDRISALERKKSRLYALSDMVVNEDGSMKPSADPALDVSALSREEITSLYYGDEGKGGLVEKGADGLFRRIPYPSAESYRTTYTVREVSPSGVLLEDPSGTILSGQVPVDSLRVVRSAVPVVEAKESLVWTKARQKEAEAKAINLPIKDQFPGRPTGAKNLTATQLKKIEDESEVGVLVKLRGDTFVKRKQTRFGKGRGQVKTEVDNDEKGNPKVRYTRAGAHVNNPKFVYKVAKFSATKVWLSNPKTGEIVATVNFAQLNEKSVNTKASVKALHEVKPEAFGFVPQNMGYRPIDERGKEVDEPHRHREGPNRGSFRKPPLRRWVNGFGVTLEEYVSPEGKYQYEVYFPFADNYTMHDTFQTLEEAVESYSNLDRYNVVESEIKSDLKDEGYTDDEASAPSEKVFELNKFGEGDDNSADVMDQAGNVPINEYVKEAEQYDETGTDDYGEPVFSLVDESESFSDGLPEFIVGERAGGGTTTRALFDKLKEAFGPGIFNIVNIVQSQRQLPVELNHHDKAGVRGVAYNNQVWLVADNLPDEKIIPVVMHEIGAHGFRSIMGDRAYQQLLSEVRRLAETDQDVKDAQDQARRALAKTHPDANEQLVAEETMAYYVENNTPANTSMWQKIFHFVLNGLHRLRLLTTSNLKGWQIMVMVRSSMNAHTKAMNSPDAEGSVFIANYLDMPLYHADDEWHVYGPDDDALREGLGTDGGLDWVKREIGPARGFARFLKIRWGTNEELKGGERLSFPAWMAKRKATEERARFVIEPGEDVHRALVDYMIIMKRYEELILKRGGNIKSSPYMIHGEYKLKVNQLRIHFRENFLVPFTNFLENKKVSTGHLHAYMYALHAKARNTLKGDGKKSGIPPSGIWSTKEQRLKAGDTGVSADELLDELKKVLGGETSQAYINLQEAAKKVYQMNDEGLKIIRDGGLITQNEVNKWMGFDYRDGSGKLIKGTAARREFARTYVPLKGDNIDDSPDFFAVFEDLQKEGGLSVRGLESRKIMGRESPAQNVWAYSIFQVMSRIDRVEKNRVDQALARFIYENSEMLKNHMLVVNDRDLYPSKKSGVKEGTDPDTGKLWLAGESLKGLHPKHLRREGKDKQHVISFKQNGEQWHIIVRDNRLGRAFNRTNVTESASWMRGLSLTNRYFAMLHTSLSPSFILTNFSRDYQTALFNLTHEAETREGLNKEDTKAMAMQVTRNIGKAFKGLRHYINTRETDTEWSALAREFSDAGGRIEFYGFRNADHVEKSLNTYVQLGDAKSLRNFWRKGWKAGKEKFLDPVSDLNSAVENTMRLSTYRTVKERLMKNGMVEGQAIKQAADVARNLTVNFTMKGEKTPLFNALWLFFNAGTAGSARALQSFNRSKNVRKLARNVFLATVPISLANYLLAGDDEEGRNRYSQIPMNQRHRQLHIYIPGSDTFIKIPLAYGFNMPFVLGDTLVALGMGQINPAEAAVHLFTSTIESFAPLNPANSDRFAVQVGKTISPTIADSLLDIMVNENWVGNPVYKEPFPGSVSVPPAYRAWSTTSKPSRFISESLNDLTGGSKYEKGVVSVDPAILDHLFSWATGSLGTFLKRSGSYGLDIITKGSVLPKDNFTGEINFNRIPIVRRFVLDEALTKKWDVRDKYEAYESEVLTANAFRTGVLNDFGSSSSEYREFKRSDHYSLYKLNNARKSVDGRITKLYKQRAAVRRNRLLREDVKEERIRKIELRIRDLRVKFVKMFEDKLDRGLRFGKAA